MRVLPILAAILLAAPAAAQDWATRDGDARFSQAELDALLRGQILIFFDDGQSHFYNDGRYTFAYDLGQGGYAYGYYEVTADGTACIEFLNGFARCDLYVENAGRLILVTEEGDRFPVRERRDAGPDPSMD
jgi:hypothetical protein